MPTPQQPQNPSNSVIDDLFGVDTASPAVSSQTGVQSTDLYDSLFGPAPQPSSNVAMPKTPPQQSESNTLWGDAKAETAFGEFGAGLQSGVRQIAATPHALAGLVAYPFDESLAESYVEWSRQIAEGGAKRGVAQVEDLTLNPMSWARYVAGVTGEAVPFVLSIMSGAGAGSLLQRVLTRAAVPAATQSLIKSTAPAFAGAFATGAAIETGATARELYEGTKEVYPITSIAAGTAKGALESLFPLILARQYGLTIGQGNDMFGQILTTLANRGGGRLGQAAAGIATEGLTELAQEEIDMTARSFFDEKFSQLSPEAWSRRLNAMIAGGVGGGILSSLTSERAQTVLLDKDIRDSVGEVPIVFGGSPEELPTTGPEHIVRTAGNGLDATAGVATGAQLDQILGEVDLRSRGLYGAVIPGRETLFGSQDQANNDNDYYQGSGFVRLDPSKITRGDITAVVEDLPSSLDDPRIDFTNPEMMSSASGKLASAIRFVGQAYATPNMRRRERLFEVAQAAYREAVNEGARVEPYTDGQIMLRDPAKAEKLLLAQATVDPQVSRANLLETRTRPGGGQFYVMASGAPKSRTRPGGKAIDLENISPDDITSFPTRDLARQVLANHQIARSLDLNSAKARGIRFTEGVANPKELLQELVNVLSSMQQGIRFYKQKADTVERFMKLVDQGLRLDVTPNTQEYAVLRQVRESELVDKVRDYAGPEISVDAGTRRLIKQRAKRSRDPRVAKFVGFDALATEILFQSQLHNTFLQDFITGKLEPATKESAVPYQQTGTRSKMLIFLRNMARSLGLKTDFFVEVVAPGSLGEASMKYIEDDRPLTPGGKPQSRSIIQIDPWKYAKNTEGGKGLYTKDSNRKNMFVLRPREGQTEGDTISIEPAIPSNLKKLGLTTEQFKAQYPGATHFRSIRETRGVQTAFRLTHTGKYDELFNALQQEFGESAARVGDTDTAEARAWKSTVENPPRPPEPKPILSKAGKIAVQLGTDPQKGFTDPVALAQFYTDFTRVLGQIIVKYEYGNLTQSEKDALYNAYTREAHAAASLSREAAMARVFAHPILMRAIGERGRKKDLYNFEEWIVQNISRAMVDPGSQLGFMQKFFARSASMIKQMLKKVADLVGMPFDADRMKGKPAKEVLDWLKRMELRGLDSLMTEEPFLSETTRKSALQSIADNQSALNGWNMEYVVATPQRASTLQVRKLLDLVPDMDAGDKQKLKGLLASADRHNTILEWLLGIHQLADLNPHIEPLRRYVTATRAMEDDALSWATMADNRLRQAQALPKPMQQALWNLMFDLDQMVYLDPKKLKDGTQKPRWPTDQELIAIVRKHKLSREAFEVYKNIRTDFLSFLTQVEITGIRNAQETITDDALLQAKITEISSDIAAMRAQPYFPHMRFGKYILTVRDAKTRQVKYFAAFDTAKARDATIVKVQKDYKVPQEASIVSDEMSPTMQQFQGLPRFALENVKKSLGLDAEQLTEQQKKDLEALEGLTFDSIPVNSFRHNLSERTNTPGYSSDGMRAYATYFARSARFVARMEYAHRLQESIKDVRRTASPISRDSRSRIADYMQRHFDAEMNPAGEWASVRALGFMWYFAFAPAAAFVNLSQVPMVTYPYLASKFPGTKRGISSAALQTMNYNIKDMKNWVMGKSTIDPNGPKQEALDEAHASRVIDDGFAQELAAVSQGSVLSRTIADGNFARGMRTVAQWGTYPFAAAERFNRSVTFRTAYDLAIANPDNPYVQEALVKNKVEVGRLKQDRGWGDRQTAAYIFATQTVRDTQFEYSRWARPKIMQGGRGVLFMFKTYLQNMMFFMFNANRGTQVRFMLMLFAVAGIMGLPGAEDAEALAKALGKLLGFDINPQLFVRRMIKDFVGDGHVADILLNGASRAGFGIPAALQGVGLPSGSADLSGSLSMGKLVPGLAALMDPKGSSFTEMLGDVTREIAGPLLGVPLAVYNSAVDSALPSDDPKRWERAMPRALKDVSRSSRYLAEKRERDTRGATVTHFDPNDISDQMDALAVGLGFQPTQLTRQWDAIQAQREVQMYWTGQRKLLLNAYGRAARLNDVEGKQDARSAIKEFNQEVPDSGLKITQDTLQKSLKTRERERKAKESRTPTAKNLRGVSREVQELFPEAPPPSGLRRRVPAQPSAPLDDALLEDLFQGTPSPSPAQGVPPSPAVIDQRRVR